MINSNDKLNYIIHHFNLRLKIKVKFKQKIDHIVLKSICVIQELITNLRIFNVF